MTRRRLAHLLPLALAGLLLVATPASADLLSPESGGSSNANDIDWLYWSIMVVAAIIFFGVEALLLYTIFKYRASRGHTAEQIRGNTRLEIAWTAGAALILVVLATLTFIKLDDIRNPADSRAQAADQISGVQLTNDKKMIVCVDGFQYGWRFNYVDDKDKCSTNKAKRPGLESAGGKIQPGQASTLYTYEELVAPVGVTVELYVSSIDVNHSWWIPQLGGKFDAVRGYSHKTWFQVDADKYPKGHTFYGQCAELCGRNHANMTARVRALPIEEFNAWAAKQTADIKAANDEIPQLKQKLRIK